MGHLASSCSVPTPPSALGKVQGHSLVIGTSNERNLVLAIFSTSYFCKTSELRDISCTCYFSPELKAVRDWSHSGGD